MLIYVKLRKSKNVISKVSCNLDRGKINFSVDLKTPKFLEYWKSAEKMALMIQARMQVLASC